MLTALCAADYFDETSGEKISNPDENGGLYVVGRNNDEIKAQIHKDDLIIQCGEVLQILTGGLLVATPHMVRPSFSAKRQVGRASFPVFVDCGPQFKLEPPNGVSREQVLAPTLVQNKVPPLESRWETGMPFIEFLGSTFKQYYSWSKQ